MITKTKKLSVFQIGWSSKITLLLVTLLHADTEKTMLLSV